MNALLANDASGERRSTPHVLGVCNWLKMDRINAPAVTAKMVELKPMRYRSDERKKDEPMRTHRASVAAVLNPIPALVFGAQPIPTTALVIHAVSAGIYRQRIGAGLFPAVIAPTVTPVFLRLASLCRYTNAAVSSKHRSPITGPPVKGGREPTRQFLECLLMQAGHAVTSRRHGDAGGGATDTASEPEVAFRSRP